ncbi:MAG: hypothetical protein JWM68_5261 [Verrucomicrobiales bacterium]|nr:hypothetical protein [Verrucomicrobiales bacterium]
MSLKAFHIVFIVSSILLTLGFGGWCLSNFMEPGGSKRDLAAAVVSLVAAIGLFIYGRYFLKKLKNITYL